MLNASPQGTSAPLLSTTLYVETPEGTTIDIQPAGLFVRGKAFLIDELFRWIIIIAGWQIGSYFGTAGIGVSLVIMFFTYWLYGVCFDVLNNGVSPGKRRQNLRVVHDDGTPIRLPASMVRNLLLCVDILPYTYLVAIVSLLVTERFQRVGDLAAGTMVVYQVDKAADLDKTDAAVKHPPVTLSQEEQTLFVEYLERAASLSEARADELAQILTTTMQTTPQQARRDIEQIAAGIRGDGGAGAGAP